MSELPQESELPRTIGAVALRALTEHGILSYAQLAAQSPTQLLTIHGVGPKAIRLLTAELQTRGLEFRSDASPQRPV